MSWPGVNIGTLRRIVKTAAHPKLRGQVVSVIGFRGATWFDSPRVIVRLVNDDGSLGDEYLVLPSILIDL